MIGLRRCQPVSVRGSAQSCTCACTGMQAIKHPHTTLFVGATGCSKTVHTWDLLEGPYRRVFETIVVVCPTIPWNRSYIERPVFWSDSDVLLVPPAWLTCYGLQKMLKVLSTAFTGERVLFIVDDCVAEDGLDRRRSALTELVNSGRHRGHSLWLISQKYTSILKTVRDQAQVVVSFPMKDAKAWEQLVTENGGNCGPRDIEIACAHLAQSRHNACVINVNPPASVNLL